MYRAVTDEVHFEGNGRIDEVFDLAKRLNSDGKAVQLKTYAGCEHAFTLPGGGPYQAEAADDAFREAVLFLRRRYGLRAGSVGPLVGDPGPGLSGEGTACPSR
jgi:hypothetical protein